jgi:hypothetical protein
MFSSFVPTATGAIFFRYFNILSQGDRLKSRRPRRGFAQLVRICKNFVQRNRGSGCVPDFHNATKVAAARLYDQQWTSDCTSTKERWA